ncbi:AAA family ATPase [Salinisphaera hydrothermalis]|uniref:AAA family ATPase n=1 Tax=Salinisphaera hydrothermalis TaxID=563188 RepID=UPI0033401C6F
MSPQPPSQNAAPDRAAIAGALDRARQAIGQRLYDKDHVVRLALACLLADGHLLIEDIPGVGKTTLAHGLADTLGLAFSRIQFVSDLLPSDILGVSVFDRNEAEFVFRPGPIFAELVLADEINRASPRTQSALLEAMAERQVTIEGVTHVLEAPFNVLATQNPADQNGTFALPDSQLDRFLMRIHLGYPTRMAERRLLAGGDTRAEAHNDRLSPVAGPNELIAWQQAAAATLVRDPLLDYLQALIAYSRRTGIFERGLSPRGGLALRRAAQAWALIDGRDHVLPEDVQAVLPAVVDHRLIRRERDTDQPSTHLLHSVDVG